MKKKKNRLVPKTLKRWVFVTLFSVRGKWRPIPKVICAPYLWVNLCVSSACVWLCVCVTHLFPLCLFNTASLGSWVGQRRKSKKAQSFQIGSMAEQIRSVIIKLLGLPVILMNYRHWIVSLAVCVCCESSERKTTMQLVSMKKKRQSKYRNTNAYVQQAKGPVFFQFFGLFSGGGVGDVWRSTTSTLFSVR